MRLPILYALAYPERPASNLTFDLAQLSQLDFAPPDLARFPCLRLAYEAAAASPSACIALNASDEIAVAAFLEGRIPFLGIPRTIERVLELTPASRSGVYSGGPRRRPGRPNLRAATHRPRLNHRGLLCRFFTPPASCLPRFAIVLGIMVLVHELGHFARRQALRRPRRSLRHRLRQAPLRLRPQRHRLLRQSRPLGGYVKMAGVGDEPVSGSEQHHATLDPGELQNHPRWQRVLIAVAGPIANFILAFVLLAGAYMWDNQVPAFFSPARHRRLRYARQPRRPHRHPARRQDRLLRRPGEPHLGRHPAARAR